MFAMDESFFLDGGSRLDDFKSNVTGYDQGREICCRFERQCSRRRTLSKVTVWRKASGRTASMLLSLPAITSATLVVCLAASRMREALS